MPETELLGRYRFPVISFILLFFSGNLFCQIYTDKEIHNELKYGIDLIINQKYADAEKYFGSLLKKNDNFPLWNLYYASSKIAKAYDYGYDYEDNIILANLNEALKKSEYLYDKDKENVWNIYFLALSKGYLAYYNALQENWFTSLKYGLSSIGYFEDCIKRDPKFYDAYVCLGIFKYWKSRKTEFFKWLPFFTDEKAVGAKYLLISKDHGSYNSYFSIYNLIWIYIDQGNNKTAIKLAEGALKQYPDVRLFKWGLARAYESVDVNRSIELYSEILNSLLKEGVNNHYKEIILKYTIARNYKKSGDKNRALKLCNEILQIENVDSKIMKKVEDRITKVKELKKELSN